MLGQMNPHLFDPFSTAYLLLPLKQGHLNLRFFDDYLVLLRCFAGITAYLLMAELGLLPVACVFGAFPVCRQWRDRNHLLAGNHRRNHLSSAGISVFVQKSFGPQATLQCRRRGSDHGSFMVQRNPHHIPLIASFSAVVTLVAAVLIERRWRPGILRIVVYCGISGCIGAPQILPSLEFAPLATRWVGLADPIQGSSRVPLLSSFGCAYGAAGEFTWVF